MGAFLEVIFFLQSEGENPEYKNLGKIIATKQPVGNYPQMVGGWKGRVPNMPETFRFWNNSKLSRNSNSPR